MTEPLTSNERLTRDSPSAYLVTREMLWAEVERLRAALGWYEMELRLANMTQVRLDGGKIARDALGAAVETKDCTCEEVCQVCGGRVSACAVLGHRPEAQRSVKWHECGTKSCHCPAKPGEDCPLTEEECRERR